MRPGRADRLWTLPFVLAFVASFLTGLAFHGFLHLPGFIQGLGADEVEIGLAIATMNLVAILARPTIGFLMDHHGRRPVVLGGAALTLLSSLLYLTVSTYGPWLFAVRMVHGFAGAAMFSVLFTIASDIVPVRRVAEGIGLFGVSGMLPMGVGGLMGDAVLAVAGYRELFLLTAGLAALALVAVLPIRDSRPPRGAHEEPARGFLRTIRQRALLPLWLVGFGMAFGLAAYFTFLKTFVLATGIGSVGLFFSTYAVSAVLLRVGLGWVPDRVGLKRVLFPSLLAGAGGALVLAQASSDAHVAAAGVLCGIGHGYAFPIISALVVTRSRPSERGAAISMFTALFDLGLLLGSPLLGLVIQATSYQAMFVTAATVTVTATLAFAVFDRNAGILAGGRGVY